MTGRDTETLRVLILPDGRMDTRNAARYLGFSEKTLAMMRSAGTGPAYVKRGRIFYYRVDLDQWLLEGRVFSTAQRPAGRRGVKLDARGDEPGGVSSGS